MRRATRREGRIARAPASVGRIDDKVDARSTHDARAERMEADSPNDLDKRLTELEIKAGFAEDLLDALNAQVARQQEAIEMLVREIARLRQQQALAAEGTSPESLRDELPPHY